MEAERILQPEDEDVSDGNDGVEEQEDLRDDDVPQDEVNEAKDFRKGTIKVHRDVRDLDEEKPGENAPADGGDHPVDEDASQVGAEPLEPDDAGSGKHRDDRQTRGQSHSGDFRRSVLEESMKEVDSISFCIIICFHFVKYLF